MNTDGDAKSIQGSLDDLADGFNKLSERQNSHYTDIMMQLKELRDEMHSRHAQPEDNRTDDDLYDEAKEAVVEMGKASTSYIQRMLGVGYSRAAQLMDLLESNGVIGPAKGSEPREVIIQASK
jgi:S-DNA-T family DNA segregation ATPase FtsK/SpoIIIE